MAAFKKYCIAVEVPVVLVYRSPYIPISPDLTPADIFLWGWMKSLVYSARVGSQKELRLRIIEAGATVKNNSDAIRRARFAWIRRAEFCVQQNGGHTEQLL